MAKATPYPICGLGASIFRFKRDYEDINPVIPYGVMAYEVDTRKSKMGDGVSPYKKLSYTGDIQFAGRGKELYDIKIPGYIASID